MSLIVSKFGGSSMANDIAMLRSAKIVLKQKSSFVLVSATHGTTDQLVDLVANAQSSNWEACENILFAIREKHFNISTKLNVNDSVYDEMKDLIDELENFSRGIFLLKECSPRAKDQILSFGERLSSLLFAEAVKQTIPNMEIIHFDVRTVLKTNSQFNKARANIELTAQMAKEKITLAKNRIYVSQGFIGSDENNVTTTLGRGGSDYSAALIAEAINADILEIWTDVAGIASTDPRICKNAQPISEISYDEASELAQYGAKILHPTTLVPAMRKNIPVFVGSSYEDEKAGTWIRHDVENQPIIRAITKRSNQVLLTIKTPKMLNAFGFMSNIFEIFTKNQISIDCVTTSEISVAVSVDSSMLDNKVLFSELAVIGEVTCEENYSLISLIGNRILNTSGLGKQVFSAIGDFNVRMVCLGASEHNFNLLVNESESNEIVNRLHSQFIEESNENCVAW